MSPRRLHILIIGFFLLLLILYLAVHQGRTSDSGTAPQTAVLADRIRERRELNAYYDFLINEWSFKFWAVFQLVTIAVLFYSTFAAIYYAKYTYLRNPPTEDDFRTRRALEAVHRPPRASYTVPR